MRRIESRVNDLLDERRLPLADAAIAEHASVCASCATIVRGYDALVEGVAAWEHIEPSGDLTSRVINQWELVKAQSSLSDSADWDSAELPALRPVGLQRMIDATPEEGFWTVRRKRAFAGGTLAAAALATAAMLLVIGGVNRVPRFRSRRHDHGRNDRNPRRPFRCRFVGRRVLQPRLRRALFLRIKPPNPQRRDSRSPVCPSSDR